MLGALAGRSSIPIDKEVIEQTVADESPKAHAQLNIDAFRAGVACAVDTAGRGGLKSNV
jgi:Pyruvate/2-oxoacid:ferredoxin oxidoreductase gamma subunit